MKTDVIGFLAIAALFVLLKVTACAEWSWWVVLSPLAVVVVILLLWAIEIYQQARGD